VEPVYHGTFREKGFFANQYLNSPFRGGLYNGYHCVILQVKWISLLHHIQDEHEWISGKCEHSPLTDAPTDSTGHTIAYFNRDDKDFQALSNVVRNNGGWSL